MWCPPAHPPLSLPPCALSSSPPRFPYPAAGYQPSVRDFDQLKALARRSGGDEAALNRGACKLCGGLGHLTKQCRNFLDKGSGAAAAGGAEAAAAAGGGDRQLLTQEAEDALLLDSDSMDSSDLGSGSDSERERVSCGGQGLSSCCGVGCFCRVWLCMVYASSNGLKACCFAAQHHVRIAL